METGKTTLRVRLYRKGSQSAQPFIHTYIYTVCTLSERVCANDDVIVVCLCVCMRTRVAVIVGVYIIHSTSSIEVRPLCGGGDYV